MARQNALEHGYAVLPEGYTFVKPHIRGHGEKIESSTVKVVAQGLQAA